VAHIDDVRSWHKAAIPVLVGDAAAHKSEISRQLVEQRFGLLQDRRVEAFGEPAVHRRD
jgi:hypothetical protein